MIWRVSLYVFIIHLAIGRRRIRWEARNRSCRAALRKKSCWLVYINHAGPAAAASVASSSSAGHVLADGGRRPTGPVQRQVAVQLHLADQESGRRGRRVDTRRPHDGPRAPGRHHLRSDYAPGRHPGVYIPIGSTRPALSNDIICLLFSLFASSRPWRRCSTPSIKSIRCWKSRPASPSAPTSSTTATRTLTGWNRPSLLSKVREMSFLIRNSLSGGEQQLPLDGHLMRHHNLKPCLGGIDGSAYCRCSALRLLPSNVKWWVWLTSYYIYQYVYNNGRKNGWHAGSISNIDDTDYKCHDGTVPEVRTKVISGVVGASSSVTSIQVANLLRLFKIPQVQRLIPFTILRSLIITRDFLKT